MVKQLVVYFAIASGTLYNIDQGRIVIGLLFCG